MKQIGRPRQYTEERVTKALRIPKDLDERLKATARERGVSVNVLMNMALEQYLDRLIPLEVLLQTA
jgi:predicted HicB family RNase H-like nuclease